MTNLTVPLSDESANRLRELSSELGVSPEDLVRASVNELLRRPDESVRNALDYVLAKNQELYRRLA